MSPLGILIQVVAASSKERYQFRNIGEVQPDHIAVNSHLSDVGPHVFCPQLAHLFFDQRFFTLVDHDNNGDLTLPVCQIITSSSAHHPSATDAPLSRLLPYSREPGSTLHIPDHSWPSASSKHFG